MTPSLSSHRNFGIDCLRGLAIPLVIVHHLALPFRLPLGPSLLGEWLPKRLIDAISFNGYEAVFMFFAISGFLITLRIIERDGDIKQVDLRRFYRARARRILPLLGLALVLLSVLAWCGVPGFAPESERQSLGGLLLSALTFTFNWYEGQTGWAPAGWDVLWSLSIEEVFYVGFPLLCLWLPRRLLIGVLLAWALGWSDIVYRQLFESNLYFICVGTGLLLLAFHAHPPAPVRGLRWLARMGSLSYELYLFHMFVVLAAVGLYRGMLGDVQTWTFVVYLPVLLCSFALARLLERGTARLGLSGHTSWRRASKENAV